MHYVEYTYMVLSYCRGKRRLFDSRKSSSYIVQDFEKVECNGNQLQLKYMYVALSDLLLV